MPRLAPLNTREAKIMRGAGWRGSRSITTEPVTHFRWRRMKPELAQDRRARRLAIHRRQLRLREIGRRLKSEYSADMAAPFSRGLCELLEKLEIMPADAGSRVPS